MKQAVSRPPQGRLELREALDWLLADGLITPEQRAEQARIGSPATSAGPEHPLVTIARRDWPRAKEPERKLNLEFLVQWLAARVQMPYVRIDPLSIDVTRVTSVIAYPYAARARILPIKVTLSEITLAVTDPFDNEWEPELSRIVKQKIVRALANPLDVQRYLVEFYALARSVKGAESERAGQSGGMRNLEQLLELGRKGVLDANDQHVVNIVDWLLNYAFEQRASDIHLEPRRETGNIRFRIDGVLHEVYQVPAGVMTAVVSRIKIVSRLDVAEKRRPQDGRIKTRSPEGKEVELRVSSLPTAFGEKMVLRVFDPDVLVKDYAALGFSKEDQQRWQEITAEPHGIILVTGPTGSGKTTTLYSTLKHLATPQVNVCTIEDPIELIDPSFNQMQVQHSIDLTFAAGVRALLRQDPDIIMVGEIRDLDTAEIAVQAALTGHLVLSTLHTNDAPSAVTRLLELGVPAYLIRATLLCVVAQRLVRTLCPHCRKPVAPDPALWKELVGGGTLPVPRQVHAAAGCLECRETGYLGRLGIYETMPMTRLLRSLVETGTDSTRLRSAALHEGMTPLRMAGARKVLAGQTSIEEVMAATPLAQG